jgi:hypothetical protein
MRQAWLEYRTDTDESASAVQETAVSISIDPRPLGALQQNWKAGKLKLR